MSASLHALSDWVRCRTKGWPCSLSPHWRRTFLKVTRTQSWWLSCRNKKKKKRKSKLRSPDSAWSGITLQAHCEFLTCGFCPEFCPLFRSGRSRCRGLHQLSLQPHSSRQDCKQRYSSTFWAFDERVIGKLGCIILQSTAAAANSPVSDSGPVSSTFKPLGTKAQKRRKSC